MKRINIIGIVTLFLSAICMVGGIRIVGYYVDDLSIRGIATALLVASNVFVWSFVGLVFRELKKIKS